MFQTQRVLTAIFGAGLQFGNEGIPSAAACGDAIPQNTVQKQEREAEQEMGSCIPEAVGR